MKKVIPMPAFQLGTVCPLAQKLMDRGFLLPLPDGFWRVKTREAMGEGELAKTGDYIKLDSTGMPYPTEKEWFEANHIQVEAGIYLQKAQKRKAWCADEPVSPEIRFLLDRGLLQWDPEDPQRTFQAQLWGTLQSAARDAVVVLDRVETDAKGTVREVEFHLVAGEEFDITYDVLAKSG